MHAEVDRLASLKSRLSIAAKNTIVSLAVAFAMLLADNIRVASVVDAAQIA